MGDIIVTKVAAARSQLRTGINLWFHDADPVSIHTLVGAAHQIIHDLNRRKKGPPLLFDTDWIKDEYRKDYLDHIKAPANFFKHADRGKMGAAMEVTFNPKSNEFFIFMSILGLQQIGEKLGDTEIVFVSWYALHNEKFLSEEGRKRFINPVPEKIIAKTREVPKSEFFKVFLELRRISRKQAGIDTTKA